MVNLNLSRIQKLKYENKQEKESFNKVKVPIQYFRRNMGFVLSEIINTGSSTVDQKN